MPVTSYLVRVTAAATMLTAAITPWPTWTASAGCVAPYLRIDDAREELPIVTRGATVTVEGRAFVEGCNDTGGSSGFLGCSAQEDEPVLPHEDILLRITQGDRQWELGREDAGSADEDQLGHVSWTITIPDGLKRGRARLVADASDSMPILVR